MYSEETWKMLRWIVVKLDVNPKSNTVVIERMYSKVKLNCGIFLS
jgi:translation elongation factor EF-1beta